MDAAQLRFERDLNLNLTLNLTLTLTLTLQDSGYDGLPVRIAAQLPVPPGVGAAPPGADLEASQRLSAAPARAAAALPPPCRGGPGPNPGR